MHTLSIVIPCYNEANLITATLLKVLGAPCDLQKEIIVVDDGSSDNTSAVLEQFTNQQAPGKIKCYRHDVNRGKGASVRTGIEKATGDIIIIQDADLEYDPSEYNKLLRPILDGHADVVFGSRFRGSEAHRILFFFHSTGNKMLTFISNLFTGLNLTDMETGYKMFRADLLKGIQLKEDRFGFEPEVTAKVSRIKKVRIYEVGISYYGRSYADGKKIRWTDGVHALYCILKYNIFSRR